MTGRYRIIIAGAVVVAAALVLWPRTKTVTRLTPGDTPAVSARSAVTAPAVQTAIVDAGTGALPPLNRDLVVMTDSDMQNLAESRQHLINRPDPF